MIVHVTVDQDRCIGAGQCVLHAPNVFNQRDDDGIVELVNPYPGAGEMEAIHKAAILCPARVITILED
jgi:ferredoxin